MEISPVQRLKIFYLFFVSIHCTAIICCYMQIRFTTDVCRFIFAQILDLKDVTCHGKSIALCVNLDEMSDTVNDEIFSCLYGRCDTAWNLNRAGDSEFESKNKSHTVLYIYSHIQHGLFRVMSSWPNLLFMKPVLYLCFNATYTTLTL